MIRRFSVTALLAMIAAGFFAPSGASAAQEGCPDGMVPVPASATQGRGDDNGDGVVCGKVKKDDKVIGGPDKDPGEEEEEQPPVEGALTVVIGGIEWWITDNTY